MSTYSFSQWPPAPAAITATAPQAAPPLAVPSPFPVAGSADAGAAAYAAYAAAYQAQQSSGNQTTVASSVAFPSSLFAATTTPATSLSQPLSAGPTYSYQTPANNPYAAAYKVAAASALHSPSISNYGPPSAPSAPHMTPSYGSSVNHGRGNNSDTGSAHAPSRGGFHPSNEWHSSKSSFNNQQRYPAPRHSSRGGHSQGGFGPRKGGPHYGPRGPLPDRDWGPRPRGRGGWPGKARQQESWEWNKGPNRWAPPARDSRSSRRDNRKPPSLMSEDFDPSKINQNERPRKRRFTESSDDRDRYSKRRVDEDLNVTIYGNDEESEMVKFYCTVCRVNIKRGYEFQQHLRGRRHKEKLAKQTSEGDTGEGDGEAKPHNLKPGVKLVTDKDIELDPTITLIPVNDEDKLKFFCLMCRVALLTEENKLCHDWSPTHLKKVQELADLAKNKSDDVALCEPCGVLHKAEEETDHKATEQHEDNIHWRLAVCDICVCKYNDISSLEKHFLSSRHRKQLDKVKSNGMEPDALTEFFENVNSQLAVKRASFCLICTTSCGNSENLEIHNVLSESFHKRMAEKASEAGENQFYCYCCDVILNESDRRFHGKSTKHRTLKGNGRSFRCEDCDMKLDEEFKLISHMRSKSHLRKVERRKALQEHAKASVVVEWKEKQLKAAKKIIDKLRRKQESEESQSTANQELAEINSDTDVIPVAGDFCSPCNVFYLFDATVDELCLHVQKSRGIYKACVETEDNVSADKNIDNCEDVEKEDGGEQQVEEEYDLMANAVLDEAGKDITGETGEGGDEVVKEEAVELVEGEADKLVESEADVVVEGEADELVGSEADVVVKEEAVESAEHKAADEVDEAAGEVSDEMADNIPIDCDGDIVVKLEGEGVTGADGSVGAKSEPATEDA